MADPAREQIRKGEWEGDFQQAGKVVRTDVGAGPPPGVARGPHEMPDLAGLGEELENRIHRREGRYSDERADDPVGGVLTVEVVERDEEDDSVEGDVEEFAACGVFEDRRVPTQDGVNQKRGDGPRQRRPEQREIGLQPNPHQPQQQRADAQPGHHSEEFRVRAPQGQRPEDEQRDHEDVNPPFAPDIQSFAPHRRDAKERGRSGHALIRAQIGRVNPRCWSADRFKR